MPRKASPGSGGFWSSLPGFMTGLAALVTACGGVYALTRSQAERTQDRNESASQTAAANQAAPADQALAATRPADPGTARNDTAGAAAPLVEERAETAAPLCQSDYVWREARPGDLVCVTPEIRGETAAENRLAASRRSPTGGAFGPATCLSGYVWREAFDGDTVCVEPASRERALADNRAAGERLAR